MRGQSEWRDGEGYPRVSRHPGGPTGVACLPGGERVTIRPIRPRDADGAQSFVRNLSPGCRYCRFFQVLRELSPDMLRISREPAGKANLH